ncbi:TetR/AcrR family transcriptional regulator [Streptomyces sp. NP160]|uniref:TetR/AcrR family transcriptional regulator n=1 Tax=Streptomyces sp. NP160 TaxID=2586637 RepID=UPI001C5A1049|nr:TetR/AcrR family transcriptional regulator [Streptomyces sp. NP160]
MTVEEPAAVRRPRADAQRNEAAVLDAAAALFAEKGVDAPVREVAERAGVGVGTVYRRFPQRSDLVAAVFRREVDACARAGPALAAEHGPADALERWMLRFTGFVATKRGLAAALHSGDPAFEGLPAYFEGTLGPVLAELLRAAVAAGEVRRDVEASELLFAVTRLSSSGTATDDQRLVKLLVDGLRYGA